MAGIHIHSIKPAQFNAFWKERNSIGGGGGSIIYADYSFSSKESFDRQFVFPPSIWSKAAIDFNMLN